MNERHFLVNLSPTASGLTDERGREESQMTSKANPTSNP